MRLLLKQAFKHNSNKKGSGKYQYIGELGGIFFGRVILLSGGRCTEVPPTSNCIEATVLASIKGEETLFLVASCQTQKLHVILNSCGMASNLAPLQTCYISYIF